MMPSEKGSIAIPPCVPRLNSSLIHQKTAVSWVEMGMAPDSEVGTLPGQCWVKML